MNLTGVRFFSHAEADGRLRNLRRYAHRKQDVGGLDAANQARGAAAGGNSGEIEIDQQRFTILAGKTHVERIGQAMLRRAVTDRVGKCAADGFPKLFPPPRAINL